MVRKKVVRKKVAGSTRTIQWKCVESRIDSKCLNYGRFILSPLKKGQADSIGITMRRALLGEIKGTCITRAKFKKVKVSHEYGRIVGIEEPVHEILLNLKQIVLRSFTNRVIKASICVSGPICVTAKDIRVPPFVEIVDTTQYIATLTIPIDLSIELQIERDRGYHMKQTKNFQDGSYPIDAVYMPVRTVNYTIHNRRNENEEEEEILFLEIWTNGSLTPKEALCEASRSLIELFTSFLHTEEGDINLKEKKNTFTTAPLFFKDETSKLKFLEELEELRKYTDKKIEELKELRKRKKPLNIPWDTIFIDQLGFSSRTYNCLKRGNINTLWDIMSTNEKDYFQIKDFNTEELLEISLFLIDMIDILVTLYKKSKE